MVPDAVAAPDRSVDRVEVAEAGLDDLESLTQLHLACLGPSDNLASLLGPAFVRAAYRWFLTAEETFVLKASVGEEIVGLTSASDVPYTAPMLRACSRQAVSSLLRRPWLLGHPSILGRLWSRQAGPPSLRLGIAQVAYTVVLPRYRGRGVGSRLKVASIRHCRERGNAGMLTGVARDNLASIALNQRFGFRELEEPATGRTRFYLLLFPEARFEETVAGELRPDSLANERRLAGS